MQGFNMGRYVPPELEGLTTGNKLHGKKPPGFNGGKQTVRFEMPFDVFCLTCDGHIAQGVRFNAEKKKVGNYFTTPIFSFRMRHTVCSGWLEIRTDPKNTAYVVQEGAKKKSADDQPPLGIIKIHDPADAAAAEDPFAKAEKSVKDKTETKVGAARIRELRELSDRQWLDPYEHSCKMRKVFRAERKLLNEKAAANEAILERTGLSITLLDESPTDAIRAKLITFGPDHAEEKIKYAHSKPLFEKPEPGRRRKCQESSSLETGKLKSQQAIEKTKEAFHKDLLRNTRAAVDPFLEVNRHDRPPRPSLGIKYNKRKAQEITEECEDEDRAHQEQDKCGTEPAVKSMVAMSLGLDDYSSE